MGNDGGRYGSLPSLLRLLPSKLTSQSIPTRRELVKEAARDPSTTKVKEIRDEQQEHYWTTCPLSHQPLRAPIVSDWSGQLYSKDAVLQQLLEAGGGQEREELCHDAGFNLRVKGLKDLVEVKFEAEADFEQNETGSSSTLKWVCPITKKRLGPGVKAIYLVPCGHAFLESVIKEVPGETCLQVCGAVLGVFAAKILQCDEPYTPNNVISILPFLDIDKERLETRARCLKEQGLTHSLKKASGGSKKRKKNNATAGSLVSDRIKEDVTMAKNPVKGEAAIGNINNGGTAALTAKVLAEQEERSKRRKMDSNHNLQSLFLSKNGMVEKHVDFMTRGFSIPAVAKR